MKRMLLGLVVLLVSWSGAQAQTTINSDLVTVRNSAPANVFFTFPRSLSNIVKIQMGCSDSAANRNYVFVYEQKPDGSIATYPIPHYVECTESYGDGGKTYSAMLAAPIHVVTPDHDITIYDTDWQAVDASKEDWKATGGSSTITIN